jgi:hypothetical protein
MMNLFNPICPWLKKDDNSEKVEHMKQGLELEALKSEVTSSKWKKKFKDCN